MGNQDHHALIFFEVVFQPRHGFRIKVVGRFVEQQDFRLFQQQLAQRHAALFPARQFLHTAFPRRAAQRVHGDFELVVERPAIHRVDLFLQRAHFLEQLVEIGIVLGIGHFSADGVEPVHQIGDGAHPVHHIALHILVGIQVRFLRQVTHAHAFGGPGFTHIFGIDAGDHLHQGRFAGAVRADDGDLRPRQERQGDILETGLVGAGIGLGQTLHHERILIGHGEAPDSGCWKVALPLADGRGGRKRVD